MKVKTCIGCHATLPLTEFHKHRDGHRSRCRSCLRIQTAVWRREHREHCNKQACKWAAEHKDKVRQMNQRGYQLQNALREEVKRLIIADYPCCKCKESRAVCLDFHHLDPKVKDSNLSSHSLTWRAVLDEAQKCTILCANCHRLLHAGQLGETVLTPITKAEEYRQVIAAKYGISINRAPRY